MKTELLQKFEFEASHSLGGYESPHSHIWKLEVGLGGRPIQGRIVDIVLLRGQLQGLIDQISRTYLNDNPRLDPETREFPTCETLSVYFFHEIQKLITSVLITQNPSVILNSVLVAICEMDGKEMGAVRLVP